MHNHRASSTKQKPYLLQSQPSFSHRQFNKLLQTVSQLQQQIEEQNKENCQLRKLVNILTNEKQYYTQQLSNMEEQKSMIYQKIHKLQLEYQSKNLLASELKKNNHKLEEDNQILREHLQETQFLFNAQEQQIERIKKEKELIENEWNKVIKQINTKMNKINRYNQQTDKENKINTANLPLQHRVKQILHRIDHNLKDTPTLYKDFNYSTTQEDLSDNSVFQLSL